MLIQLYLKFNLLLKIKKVSVPKLKNHFIRAFYRFFINSGKVIIKFGSQNDIQSKNNIYA